MLPCRVTADDSWCRRCREQGSPQDTVTLQPAHEPFGWRPTTLLVTIRRYRCEGCRHVWRRDSTKAADPRAKLSRRGLRWALEALMCQRLSVARVADGLAVSWNTANNAVLAEGQHVPIADPDRFDAVMVIGVDEQDRALLGCSTWSKAAPNERSKTGSLSVRDPRATPCKSLPRKALPDSQPPLSRKCPTPSRSCTRSMWSSGPATPSRIAGAGSSWPTCGHRGRKTIRSTRRGGLCRPGADLLTDKHSTRLPCSFAADAHAEV